MENQQKQHLPKGIYLAENEDELHNTEVIIRLPMCDRTRKTEKMKSTLVKEQSAKPLFSSVIFPP